MRRLLEAPTIYRLFHYLIGTSQLYRTFVRDYLSPRPQARVLDVGCGPGNLLEFLPSDVNYVGVDISADYIREAHRRFPRRGKFTLCDAALLSELELESKFDFVVAVGVLHHLDDQQVHAFLRGVTRHLTAEGKFVSVDPLLFEGQSRIARFITLKDRGEFVRTALQYRALFTRAACCVKHESVVCGLVRIPYTHIIFQVDTKKEANTLLASPEKSLNRVG